MLKTASCCAFVLLAFTSLAFSQRVSGPATTPTVTPSGESFDALYYSGTSGTFAQQCSAAVTNGVTLILRTLVASLPTQTAACNIHADKGGILRPGSGQTVTLSGSFSGDLTQHVDLSLGGRVVFTGSVGIFYPQWFGAIVDGVTDDTAAIQNTFNAATGTVQFTGMSAISSMVYVPQGNSFTATLNLQGTNWRTGLIFKPGSAPTQMLRVYAQSTMLNNFYLNCNRTATSGLVLASASQAIVNNVLSQYCTGDGIQINPAATPITTLNSALTAGQGRGATFTVASNSLPGITFGMFGCTQVYFEYGTPMQEQVAVSAVGTTLTLGTTLARNHGSESDIQCAGNNNNAYFYNVLSGYNRGWGFDVFGGSDENGIISINPQMFNNTLGGERWSGSVNQHLGGHSEANTGYALQLGDINGGSPTNGLNGRSTFGMTVAPFGDLENSSDAYDSVYDVCGQQGSIQFRNQGEYTFPPLASQCPAVHNYGPTDIAFGLYVNNGFPALAVITPGSLTQGSGSPNGTAFGYVISPADSQPSNIARETDASVNNAITAIWVDPIYSHQYPLSIGSTVFIALAHSCGLGCKIDVNGHAGPVVSKYSGATGIAKPYAAGGVIQVQYQHGNWVDLSQ